jgi:phosphopantetheine adenylyltransferase
MFNWNKPSVQLLGRYQPWHPGHRALFIKAHEKTGQVVIMLRDLDDDKNPFSAEERTKMIVDDLATIGYNVDKDFIVIPVPNITNITYGRDVGYAIEQEKLDDEIEKISATKIRAEMNK